MSKIMHDVLVPIPACVKEHKDCNPSVRDTGRINLVYVSGSGEDRQFQRVGVKSDTPGMMHPNQKYFALFGGEYMDRLQEGKVVARERVKQNYPVLKVGIFAVVCAIAIKLGILPILVQTHGINVACAILDYVCFLIACSSNSTRRMTCELYDHVLFTSPVYSDSWYSELFCDRELIVKNNLFQDVWIRSWISKGVEDVYVSVDGTNIDCESEENEDAERGHDKTGEHNPIISFMWVVIASGEYKGIPIAHVAYQGSQPDCTAIHQVVAKLKNYAIETKGSILDRGFCTKIIMRELPNTGLPFTIMMPDRVGGHTQMVNEHGEEIREHPEYYIDKNRYGTVDNVQVFKKEDITACVALIYDPIAAAFQRTDLMSGTYKAKLAVEKALANGIKYEIPKKYAQYLIIGKDTKNSKNGKDDKNEKTGKEIEADNKPTEVTINYEKLSKAMNKIGYSAIASSEDKSAKEISEIYDLREASELAFKYFKTPLGGKRARTHTSVSSRAKIFVGEIAVSIYTDLANTCISLDMDPSDAVLELDKVFYLLSNNIYVFSNNMSLKVRALLQEFGISEDTLREYERIMNKRYLNVDQWSRSCTTLEECLILVKTLVPSIPEIPGLSSQDVWDFIISPSDQEEQDGNCAIATEVDSPQGNCAIASEVCGPQDDCASCYNADVQYTQCPLENSGLITEESDSEPDESAAILLAQEKTTKPEIDSIMRDTIRGELVLTNTVPVLPQESPRKRGRPTGSKDSQPRTRRTNAELGKPTKYPPKKSAPKTGSSKRGRPLGSKDSYKRPSRKNAGQQENSPDIS